DEVFAYNRNTLVYAQAYALCGESEKASEVLRRVAESYGHSLRYYMKFPAKYRRSLQSETQEAVDVLGSVKYLADAYGLTEVSTQVSDMFRAYNIQEN
ncbi:MAG: hypothetical protein K2I87_02550, partial [Bacteroidales bacterium]|nr:hypothetical protein [Bacteroidales bacterium]